MEKKTLIILNIKTRINSLLPLSLHQSHTHTNTRTICNGEISYNITKMDSSNLNIFSEFSSLGGDNFSFLMRHFTDRLQAEHG